MIGQIMNALTTEIRKVPYELVWVKLLALSAEFRSVSNFCLRQLVDRLRNAPVSVGFPGSKVKRGIEVYRRNARSDLMNAVMACSNFTNSREVLANFEL